MIYEGYDLTEFSRLKSCPECYNEQINPSDSYCKICGRIVVNECTACGALASGNARYCVDCGYETTFYDKGLLENWKEDFSIVKET